MPINNKITCLHDIFASELLINLEECFLLIFKIKRYYWRRKETVKWYVTNKCMMVNSIRSRHHLICVKLVNRKRQSYDLNRKKRNTNHLVFISLEFILNIRSQNHIKESHVLVTCLVIMHIYKALFFIITKKNARLLRILFQIHFKTKISVIISK